MATKAPARDRILDAAHDLVLQHGFNATTVDAVLERSGASKGAFFHHFPTKAALGHALVDRYARADAAVLDEHMATAEARADDPARQVVELLRALEETAGEMAPDQPGCLFVSFIYEQVPETAGTHALILESIELWRERILDKLARAGAARALGPDVDLPALADQVFTTFEGAFILARATGDPGHVRRQLAHLRHYLELLLDV